MPIKTTRGLSQAGLMNKFYNTGNDLKSFG